MVHLGYSAEHLKPAFEIYIVGYSAERDCFENHFMLCDARPITDADGEVVVPFKVYKTEWWRFRPLPVLEEKDRVRLAVGDPDQYDDERDGMVMLNAMRNTKYLPGGEMAPEGSPDGASFIGGFAQLTRIDREGLTSRVIHRWPDQIGRRLVDDTIDGDSANVSHG